MQVGHLEDVRVHDLDIGQAGGLLTEDWHEVAIDLNGHDAPGQLRQNPSQVAQASPNLNHSVVRRKISSGSYTAQNRWISQKVLAQSLAWI
jgi:hypothetical protein